MILAKAKIDTAGSHRGLLTSLTRQKGFTLLELLVSISLLVLVIGLAGMAMNLSFRAMSAGENKIESLERIRSSLYVVSAQLQSQIPMVDFKGEVPKVYFQGQKSAMRFVSGYSLWGGSRALVEVSYEARRDEMGKTDMLIREQSYRKANAVETVLFKGLDDLSFEYFSRKTDIKREGQWEEQWTHERSVPEQIRVHIVWKGDTFSLTVPIRGQLPDA